MRFLCKDPAMQPVLVLIQLKMNLGPGRLWARGRGTPGSSTPGWRASAAFLLPARADALVGTQSARSPPWLQMPEARSLRAPKPSSIFSPSISPSNSCNEALCLAGQGSIAASGRSAADKGGTAALPRHRHIPRWGLQGLLRLD